ncbi:uncharacterized protein [Choristoneura fumiferana]|uniref:uncharacterized protein n=1 Tax=Choristoneura fumiferana TaxID=7141 RepID=UPI003D15E879
MVYLAFVLITVSALATLNNAEPTEELVVHHACEGETFCAVKPENYPQDAIDRILIRNLPHLHRMKREVIEPAPANPEGNCGVTKAEMISPFTLRSTDGVPKVIVQSKWFNQKVPQVHCKKEKGECFSRYTLDIIGVKIQCQTKKLVSSIVVYNANIKEFETVDTEVDVDCACVVKNE